MDFFMKQADFNLNIIEVDVLFIWGLFSKSANN
nr:MAG TPA: hypothetical protein [Bacteriophage sp.]